MESRVEVRRGPGGALAEVGIVSFQGREFAAGGAVVDFAGGRVLAYLSGDRADGFWRVQTWGGDVIGRAWVVSSWRVRWSCIGGGRMYAIRARIEGDDRTWIGRGWGPGLWVKLRPAKALQLRRGRRR